jgi:hypothetical protein
MVESCLLVGLVASSKNQLFLMTYIEKSQIEVEKGQSIGQVPPMEH